MVVIRTFFAMVLAGGAKAFVDFYISPEILHAEIHGVAAYLDVLGALYGIVLAFIIFVVWDQFNKVQIGVNQEASGWEDFSCSIVLLTDREAVHSIKNALNQYLSDTVSDEPTKLEKLEPSTVSNESFHKLVQTVRGMKLNNPKDLALYKEILRSLERITGIRDSRLSISHSRIPGTLWSLILFVSYAILGGFLCLGIRIPALSVLTISGVAGCQYFLLAVIKDMDNPFDGEWNVSYAPFSKVITRVSTL